MNKPQFINPLEPSSLAPATLLEKVKQLYQEHEKWVPLTFFILGFLFDTLMLRRIDDWTTILQQGAYLGIAGTLISFDFLQQCHAYRPSARIEKAWKYREAVIHFMLGTLLNGYTIFYFKSASVFTSLVFVAILVAILTVNEFKRFGGSQTGVHMGLFSLCLVSYFVYLVPILMGFIGKIPFMVALATSSQFVIALYLFIRSRLARHSWLLIRQLLVPAAAIHLLFFFLYKIQAIPPVPLSVSYLGIFHDISRENGKFKLSYTRPAFLFWQKGDQFFAARSDDKIYCFVRVFSPTRFKDEIQVRWLYKDSKKGWQNADAIPLLIAGGREEGYRGYTVKGHYEPGEWRVQIETSDSREISRIYFNIVKDETKGPRIVRTLYQ